MVKKRLHKWRLHYDQRPTTTTDDRQQKRPIEVGYPHLKREETRRRNMQLFILGNLANLALAMYKYHTTGLLQTHESDWLAFADPGVTNSIIDYVMYGHWDIRK
jgi:hypothetical protein